MAEHRQDPALSGIGAPSRGRSALPIQAFVADARDLTPEAFEARHGRAFLVFTSARIDRPGATSSTEMLLDDEAAGGNARTANLSLVVFPLRPRSGPSADVVTLGREEKHDVVIPDRSVSRFHALGKCGADGVFQILDAGSTNGTSVNGKSVPGRGMGSPTRLRPGDTLRVGQVEFTFTDARALREFALQIGG